jgi:predicted O-linked N-acetylglucosamine transferase (SPINDLY family)
MPKTPTPNPQVLLPFHPWEEAYQDLWALLDVNLDSFPVGGHSTSMDALSASIPTVTLPGQTIAGGSGVGLGCGGGVYCLGVGCSKT